MVRFGRRAPGPSPEVPDTFGAVTLVVVAERAAALVPGFRAFLLACSLPGDPVGSLGREGHRLATEFDRLHGWAADSPVPPGLETERSCLLAALSYHRMIVHDALQSTFPKVRAPPHRRTPRCLERAQHPDLRPAGAGGPIGPRHLILQAEGRAPPAREHRKRSTVGAPPRWSTRRNPAEVVKPELGACCLDRPRLTLRPRRATS